ncbi:hypothetical protein ACIOWI_29465 [Streptomyces sp. NPDC087659]|uniref:hypothetical protein n=1 Tax=Streptomyces sp. NPDC087659 TaxID=3365801 RepID=UPI00380F5022
MTRPDYRGTVDTSDEVAAELAVLARLLPLGSRVRHKSGRMGTVTLDQPPNVPGTFAGKPTAWCFSDVYAGEPMVCAAWDNDAGVDRWLVWVPVAYVRSQQGARPNRPARIGAAR